MMTSSQGMFFEFGLKHSNDGIMEDVDEQAEQLPQTSISDLSPEILVIVLSFLPIEDLSRFKHTPTYSFSYLTYTFKD